MNEADPIYPGGAFQGSDDSSAVVGQITISMFSLRFETEGFALDLPVKGLRMDLDESGERALFTHPNYPEWTIYSIDPSIFDHRTFQQPLLKKRVDELHIARTETPKHARRVYGAFAGIAATLLCLWAFTDFVVGIIVNMLPPEWENKVGKQAFAEVTVFLPITDDAVLTNRVHLVSERLKKGLPPGAPKFRYHVSLMPIVNAIALPGGDVIVMEGLLEDATPDELAAVLAHETAHVIEKHAMRQIAQEIGPAFVGQYIFGGDSALNALMIGASALGQLHYSRANERHADQLAFEILLRANIDPRSLANFFRKIEKIEKKAASQNDLFSTHPPTAERIKSLSKLWDESPKKSGFEQVNGGPDIRKSRDLFR